MFLGYDGKNVMLRMKFIGWFLSSKEKPPVGFESFVNNHFKFCLTTLSFDKLEIQCNNVVCFR